MVEKLTENLRYDGNRVFPIREIQVTDILKAVCRTGKVIVLKSRSETPAIYDGFTRSVIRIIKKIPAGKVISYGMVAEMAGNPRGARQVSWILHSMSGKHNLPWWRIINSKGNISIRHIEGKERQKAKLESEGVRLISDYRVDLDACAWKFKNHIK